MKAGAISIGIILLVGIISVCSLFEEATPTPQEPTPTLEEATPITQEPTPTPELASLAPQEPSPTPELATATPEEATPTLLWERQVSGIRAVQYDGRTAFVAVLNSGVPEVHAVQMDTGDVLWRREFEPYGSRTSLRGKLLAADGIVYFHHIHKEDGRANYFALEGTTGETIWTFQLEGSGRFPRWEIVDGVLYLHAWDHYVFDPPTGEMLWKRERVSIPISVSDGIMHFFGNGEIVAVDSTTGSDLWRHQVSGLSTARVVGGVVYAEGGGSVRAVDAGEGVEKWRREDADRLIHFRAANDQVALLTSSMREMSGYAVIHPSDELCAIDAIGGSVLWCKTSESSYSSTLMWSRDEVVYLADETRLIALRASDGTQLWTRDWLDGELVTIPLVRFVGDVAYFGSLNAMDPQSGRLLWGYGSEEDAYFSTIGVFDNGDMIIWASQRGLTAISLSASTVAADESRSASMPDLREQCSNGIAVPNPRENPGLVEDCAILLSIKETLVGNVGTLYAEARLNWSPQLSISEWDGVNTHRVATVGPIPEITPTPSPPLPDRVRRLSLYNRGLAGKIPPAIGGLSALGAINLNDNELTGEIPPELGNLVNLGILSLCCNKLEGNVPPELGNLVYLGELNLNYNQLSGTIPRELGALTQLSQVYMRNEGFSGCIPKSWQNVHIQQYWDNLSQYCE